MEANKNPSRDFWNRDDLRVYILLYCANADLVLKEEELDFIKSNVKSAQFDAIRKEFDEDNDYQSIKKIEESIAHLSYDKKQIEELIEEIKELFWADGEFDNVERAIFRQLKHLLD